MTFSHRRAGLRAVLGAPSFVRAAPAVAGFAGLLLTGCGPGAAPPAERPPLKIYVNTDLEGISGVFKFAQTREKDTPLNIQACEYFMGDVAAVVKGLRDGGATEVVVLDGHGPQAVLPHLMAPGAVYVTGRPRPGAGNLSGLDESFGGMVMLGLHAMMGTSDGVLNHTQSPKSENRCWYNGVESGELAQNAAIAGHFGVPPIMVTGDEATCREAKAFFGNDVVTVATKRGLSREAACPDSAGPAPVSARRRQPPARAEGDAAITAPAG